MVSAKLKEGIDLLKNKLVGQIKQDTFQKQDTFITNIRHYENLKNIRGALNVVLSNMDNHIGSEFLVSDLKVVFNYLGEITGEITTDDLLDNIFSKFCIGK